MEIPENDEEDMKMKKELANEIKAVAHEMGLDAWDREYEYVGIRVQEQEFELGEITHKSHNWGYNDNYETVDFGEELDGICCTRLEEAEKSEYFGDHIAVICGNHATFGEDDGEIIIEDPVVVKIIR